MKSTSLSPSAARMMFRPIRPKPLIPTLTAIVPPGKLMSAQNRHSIDWLAEGQTNGYDHEWREGVM
jgi:hypothetical protein